MKLSVLCTYTEGATSASASLHALIFLNMFIINPHSKLLILLCSSLRYKRMAFALLGCCTASVRNCPPTFRHSLSLPSSRAKQYNFKSLPVREQILGILDLLKKESKASTETPVTRNTKQTGSLNCNPAKAWNLALPLSTIPTKPELSWRGTFMILFAVTRSFVFQQLFHCRFYVLAARSHLICCKQHIERHIASTAVSFIDIRHKTQGIWLEYQWVHRLYYVSL